MQDINSETVEKAAQGDVDAFETIYNAYFSIVSGIALRVVNRREEAEEVTQDVFMTIHRNLGNFRFESSLKTWIYRIAVNAALNHAKRISKHHTHHTEYDESRHASAQSDPRADVNEEYVTRLLESVTLEQKACLLLRGVEGLSYQEIAATLRIPVNTVRSRIKRAREAMMAARNEVIRNAM